MKDNKKLQVQEKNMTPRLRGKKKYLTVKCKDFSLFGLSKSWLDYSVRTFTEQKYQLLKAL